MPFASQRLRLLIVEDDPEMGAGLVDFFQQKGFEPKRVEAADEALEELRLLPPYDLALLDVNMPEKDGFEVLREARRRGVQTPIVMLTVRSEEADKLRGFSLGADDYVTKPFSADELHARVRAVLRRSRGAEPAPLDRYRFGEVEVNFSSHTAQSGGEEIPFTALEFNVLKYFIEHRGRTVSRKQLLRDVWRISGDVETRTIDRHVASLRKKVEPDPANPRFIETVYGIGYKFVG